MPQTHLFAGGVGDILNIFDTLVVCFTLDTVNDWVTTIMYKL